MATARDIVTRALRKRRVIGIGREPKASELASGIDDLNDMLSQWSIDGIDFNHVPLTANDTPDIPESHIQTLVLSLAERLTDYGGALDPMDIMQAQTGRRALMAYYFGIADMRPDNPLWRDNLAHLD